MKMLLLVIFMFSCSNDDAKQDVIPKDTKVKYEPSQPQLVEVSSIKISFPQIQLGYVSEASNSQVIVTNSQSSPIFSCHKCADGTTIDSSTGLVSWSYSSEGKYSSIFKVEDDSGSLFFNFDIIA